jgi:alkylation response protein AidB-like acyl-CoA dehydrogenase
VHDLPDLRLDPELTAWRREVRAFLADEMAQARIAGHLDPTDLTGLDETFERAHHRAAGARGYLGISLPTEFGGGGRPPSWRAVYGFEAAYADAPSIDTAVVLCGGPLVAHGSPAQKAAFLPAMARGELTGCIAYTEPGAGSDLGALTTTARRVDGGFVLDGRKTLITGAHKADRCMTVARTDPDAPNRSAMTMFWLPTDRTGVRVEATPTIAGWRLYDVVFEGVFVADDEVLGAVGAGWPQLMASMSDERSGLAHLGWATRRIEEMIERHGFDDELAALVVDLGVAVRFCARVLDAQDAATPQRHEPSVAKIWVTELLARAARIDLERTGPAGFDVTVPPLRGVRTGYEILERIHPTISVGANEVQRDTVARFALGLGGRR